MSEFFKAPAVRAAMAEIQELQEDIMTGIAVRGMRDPSSEAVSYTHLRAHET